jgi:RimJ/RimL family protein N-acetyltransferase
MNDRRVTDGTGATCGIINLSSEKKRVEEAMSKSDIYIFSIIKKEDNQLLGNVGLNNIHPVHQKATLGILIGEIDEHNKGYGTDAIQCILNYGFNQLNLHTIELHVHDFNENAKKCYEKC